MTSASPRRNPRPRRNHDHDAPGDSSRVPKMTAPVPRPAGPAELRAADPAQCSQGPAKSHPGPLGPRN